MRLLLAAVLVSSVHITIAPGDSLFDTPVDVRVSGLHAHERVTLQATAGDVAGRPWRSAIPMRADAHGVLDTHGSMRFSWAMRGPTATYLPPTVSTVRVAVLRGRKLVAQSSYIRRLVAPDVTHTSLTVAQNGLAGTFYERPGRPPATAIIALGGSAGGHGGTAAALFASHGYPSLSLGYFDEPGLPRTLQNIPLEYFRGALQWLAAQPGVDPGHLVVLGRSRGGELAILLGATYPDLVHGVVACTTLAQVLGGSPSGSAWTLGGKPVPFGPLPVDKLSVPTLITGGGKDEIVDSGPATEQLLERAHAAGRANVTGRVYANAGHSVGCNAPNLPVANEVEGPPGTFRELGGTPEANAVANAAAWPRLLRFLATA